MKKAVIIFSGGLDSVCTCCYLRPKYDLYGITFSYGQKGNKEISTAKKFSKILKFKEHKVVNIDFMKSIYGNTNALTSNQKKIPKSFDYTIVVPIRNAIFLSIASGWAFKIGASFVSYGAHKGDKNYPDCRPAFSKKLEEAINFGEIDGIRKKLRKKIEIWSPYKQNLSKSDLLKIGFGTLQTKIFDTWSCYASKSFQCGECESCRNRKSAFQLAKINDQTKYLVN